MKIVPPETVKLFAELQIIKLIQPTPLILMKLNLVANFLTDWWSVLFSGRSVTKMLYSSSAMLLLPLAWTELWVNWKLLGWEAWNFGLFVTDFMHSNNNPCISVINKCKNGFVQSNLDHAALLAGFSLGEAQSTWNHEIIFDLYVLINLTVENCRQDYSVTRCFWKCF